MRGTPDRQPAVYHTFSVEDLIEPGHPLRPIKRMVDRALSGMRATFKAAYSSTGRPGIPPETLLKALLLQCLYTIRSERELCRRLKTDLLFRWFLDLQPSDDVFDHSVFSHNRDRLAEHGITQKFFDSVVQQAIAAGLTSDEHFTVDGTLIQSHASLKSLRQIERNAQQDPRDDDSAPPPPAVPPQGRNTPADFKGQKRSNATHRSGTDPEARLYKKGDGVGAFLCHSGHALAENRHGLVVAVRVDEASGTAERECTLKMLDHARRRHGLRPATLGADKGYDAGPFLLELQQRWIEPHVAIRPGKIEPHDDASWARWDTRHEQRRAGFRRSQRRRKMIEEFFGWAKVVAGMRRARHVGRVKIAQCFHLAAAAYNLVRMRSLLTA
jgi:transposase